MTDPSGAPPPRFLADRCLGRVTIEMLRELGWDIVRLADLEDDDAQATSDEQLVAIAAKNRWAVLTKDKRIRYQPSFNSAGTPLFALSDGGMTIAQTVERFEEARHRIWAGARAVEAQFWIVYEHGRIERRA